MKNFRVVFKIIPIEGTDDDSIGYDDLEIEADYYESSNIGEPIYFIEFFKKKGDKSEIVCTLSAESILHITECQK